MVIKVQGSLFFCFLLVAMISLLQGRYLDEKDWLNNVMETLSRSRNELNRRDNEASSPSEPETDLQANFLKPGHIEDKRIGFGGVLCCNHPPTRRPPTTKRSNQEENYLLKRQLLASIVSDFVESAENKEKISFKNQRPLADDTQSWKTAFSFEEDKPYKRGVKIMRGGLGDVNAG